MFSFTELNGQSSLLHKSGTVEFNTTYVTRRKPLWLIALKLLGVAAMVAVGYGLLVPTLVQCHLRPWQAIAIASGLMLVYMGIAFFVRPEANTDNLGWGIGGLANDPYQYADNVNRTLWNAHCLLGPGRFTAEALLDTCVVLRLAGGEEVVAHDADAAASESSSPDSTAPQFVATESSAEAASLRSQASSCSIGLSPNRFEQPRGQ